MDVFTRIPTHDPKLSTDNEKSSKKILGNHDLAYWGPYYPALPCTKTMNLKIC